MKKTLLTIALLFVLVAMGAARGPRIQPGKLRLGPLPKFVTPNTTVTSFSNASLKGSYVFYLEGGKQFSWGQTLNCGGQLQFWGGNQTRSTAVVGVVNFDGLGNLSGTITQYGQLDQNASDASVSCGNNGQGVFLTGQAGSLSGTYSIQANGTGTTTLTVSGGGGGGNNGNFILTLAGNCTSTGVADTVLLTVIKTDNAVDISGYARLQ